ncbi:MAG: chorismate mutase [Blastocatellia bacterium]
MALETEKRIDDWRIRIDEIDQLLVSLFNERSQCAIEIGHIKRRLGLDVYSPTREAQVIANVTGANHGPLDNDAIRRLFERVIDESRRIERIQSRRHDETNNNEIAGNETAGSEKEKEYT